MTYRRGSTSSLFVRFASVPPTSTSSSGTRRFEPVDLGAVSTDATGLSVPVADSPEDRAGSGSSTETVQAVPGLSPITHGLVGPGEIDASLAEPSGFGCANLSREGYRGADACVSIIPVCVVQLQAGKRATLKMIIFLTNHRSIPVEMSSGSSRCNLLEQSDKSGSTNLISWP